MASYSHVDPSCVSGLVFTGNVRLSDFTETDPRYTGNPATLSLTIDGIAAPGHSADLFYNTRLELEIVSPATASFVIHSAYIGNSDWYIPGGPTGWTLSTTYAPTPHLMLIDKPVIGLRGLGTVGNGRSFRVGIKGVPTGGTVVFKTTITATPLAASVSSCQMSVNIMSGEVIAGYLS
jgi:hypothetical protein